MTKIDTKQSQKPLLQVLHGEKTARIPVWFMRQAGRYLPEYQAIRANHDFVALCQNPKLAAEVTLQPMRRFDLDAAIIFADILLIATCLGQDLSFGAGHGPILRPKWDGKMNLGAFKEKDATNKLSYVGEALEIVKKSLNPSQSLIGFAGAPLTVAIYMLQGGA